MKNTFFITGTDTDVGKTFVTCLLLQEFGAQGLTTFAQKPIASGAEVDALGELKNADALALQKFSSVKCSYHEVNPIVFSAPIAPHIAAANNSVTLTAKLVQEKICSSMQKTADINLIEGVGGWAVPLNNNELFSDAIVALQIPVVLVVGVKLGCLNHAILTSQNIISRNAPFIGWIANCLDANVLAMHENIQALQKWIPRPCLGVVPFAGENMREENNVHHRPANESPASIIKNLIKNQCRVFCN
jgi:dethiobiotin synthetase